MYQGRDIVAQQQDVRCNFEYSNFRIRIVLVMLACVACFPFLLSSRRLQLLSLPVIDSQLVQTYYYSETAFKLRLSIVSAYSFDVTRIL